MSGWSQGGADTAGLGTGLRHLRGEVGVGREKPDRLGAASGGLGTGRAPKEPAGHLRKGAEIPDHDGKNRLGREVVGDQRPG